MRPFGRVGRVYDGVTVAAVVLCTIELCLVTLAIWLTVTYQDTVEDRNQGRSTVAALDSATLGLVDAESAQRGYLITGEDRFLEPYQRGLERVDRSLEDVGQLVSGEPAWVDHQHALVALAATKRVVMAETIDARRQGANAQQVASLVANGEGKELMDEFRARRRLLTTEVVSRVNEKDDRADRLAPISLVSSAVLALLTVGIVILLGASLRRRAEAASLRLAAVAKDEFVGFVSHELRAPIALIAGNARHITQHANEPDPERAASAREISRGAVRLEAIVATLLSLAKAESGGLLPVEPVLVQRVVETVLRHHKALFPQREITFVCSPTMPPVMADREAVEQVLVNLLQNAERYGDESAPIIVEIEATSPSAVTISVVNAGLVLDNVQFSRVFEPFFRMRSSARAAGGIGLGLTVCHRLIAAQGGAMFAEARTGGGARFSFWLAIAEDPGE